MKNSMYPNFVCEMERKKEKKNTHQKKKINFGSGKKVEKSS